MLGMSILNSSPPVVVASSFDFKAMAFGRSKQYVAFHVPTCLQELEKVQQAKTDRKIGDESLEDFADASGQWLTAIDETFDLTSLGWQSHEYDQQAVGSGDPRPGQDWATVLKKISTALSKLQSLRQSALKNAADDRIGPLVSELATLVAKYEKVISERQLPNVGGDSSGLK
eukprot:15468346-Alexandrium_andersonii.AAC.1